MSETALFDRLFIGDGEYVRADTAIKTVGALNAEIASLRAQLDEARKALSDIAGASWGQASNGQPMTHKRLTIDRAEQALRALLSESKS